VRCELEQDDDVGTFPGVTLFTKSTTHCIKPTAVYFSPKHSVSGNVLNVVLWLHGFYVRNHKFLFHNDRARIREQVRDCGKDVVLIAPFLGFEYAVDDTHFAGNYNVEDLATPKWGERYLNEVLAALSHFLVPDARPSFQLQVDKLIIACHSGGGVGMRNLVGNLGKYQSNLRACWGLDCLLGEDAKPDDATFWWQWLSGPNGRALDIIYGPSTLPQSVKLDLIGRGLATPKGDKAEPRRAALKNLNVSIGHYDAFPAFGQMVKVNDLDPAFVDRFMIPPTADVTLSKHKPRPDRTFLQQAIANVRREFPFPKDIHYMIARGSFLYRLSKL
jgi:hypothetical protein